MGAQSPVADNSTLSNFARSGHLDLLRRLIPHGVWVPAKVIEELQRGAGKYPSLQDLLALQGNWLREIPPEKEPPLERVKALQEQFRRVRKGADAWVIASAETLDTAILSDDQGILKTCRQLVIPVLTTACMLGVALNLKILTAQEVEQILKDLRDRARFNISWENLSREDL